MTQLNWTVQGETTAHTVTLEYSFWTCRHRLSVDNRLICDKRILREFGAEIEFDVEGHKGTLFVDVPGRLTFDHALMVEGFPVRVSTESKPNLLLSQRKAASEETGISAARPLH